MRAELSPRRRDPRDIALARAVPACDDAQMRPNTADFAPDRTAHDRTASDHPARPLDRGCERGFHPVPRRASRPARVFAALGAAVAGLALAAADHALADVRLDPLFRDHAVLQRGRPIPVRGVAMPGERVEVAFGAVRAEGTAGADGRFSIELPAMDASLEPRELVVKSPSGTAKVSDVLVGEVWFCSGQSNMEWTVDASDEAPRAKELASRVPIRSFKAPHVTAARPADDVPGAWRVASADTVGSFTAVGFWFGVDLARALDLEVPIGLVDISWGGTRIEPWIPRDLMLASDVPAIREAAQNLEARVAEFESVGADARDAQAAKEVERFRTARAEYWKRALADEVGARELWSNPETSKDYPAAWRDATLPAFYSALDPALDGFDGFVWHTRTFDVPAAWADRPLTLVLPPIDDADVVYIDGVEVGDTVGDWTRRRSYEIPRGLKAGVHRITVAALDMHGQGGFAGGPMRLMLAGTKESVDLAGAWKWRQGGGVPRVAPPVARDVTKSPGTEPHEPAAIWNAMMAPCIAFPARGAIWYQGESNAGEPDNYRKLLPLLMESWRAKSGNPDLAWGIVQLAAFQPFVEKEPAQGAWALLREAQFRGSREARGGFASAIDLGDAADIHPRRKREVGERLAAWARATQYGESSVEWRGPELASATRENGGMVRLRFEHARGMRATGGKPGGFALAGADGKFVWAEATIMDEGRDGIVLSAPGVAEPVEVVYAWQNNPERANVVNGAGLPMIPFRAKIAP
jgi:sialate O-acetylesterase